MNVDSDCQQFFQNQLESNSIQSNLEQLLRKLSIQSLRSSEKIFNPQTFQALASQFKQVNENRSVIQFLEELIDSLLNCAHKLKHELASNSTSQDYEALQRSIQKSEAEIRKHIKIQQQLKLYLDNLQEKIQYLENKLDLEQNKYQVLFEKLRQLDEDNKKIIYQTSQSNGNKQYTHQYQLQSIQMATNQNLASRKSKLGLKNKYIMDKLQERNKKMNEKKNQILSISKEDINVQVSSNNMQKGSSIDRYKPDRINHSSIRQLAKSLHMRHQRSFQCYNKRRLKNKTEVNQKQGRSNSIFN